MELRKLEVFCKVVELKSFTRAAAAVMLSQPTVSEHIRSLEEELGQKLVDRLGRQVEPTPVGNLLYGYAVKILRLQEDALQAVEQYSGKLIGRIMIGAGTIPGTFLLPGLIGRFRRRYPSVKATVRINSSHRIVEEVLDGRLEIGVVGARWSERGLDYREVFSDRLTVIVPPGHPLAVKHEVGIAELAREPFILRENGSGTRQVVDRILGEHGVKTADLSEVAEIGSTAAVLEAVREGLGVSIVSAAAVERDVAAGTLAALPLKGIAMERPFYMVRRKNRELSPAASVFWVFLLQES
ncbi:MAG: selenium metabolism-associated LysR family transcriptional regulator [Desulfobulbaceae bacterium]